MTNSSQCTIALIAREVFSSLYRELSPNSYFRFDEERVIEVKEELLSGRYRFSPLKVTMTPSIDFKNRYDFYTFQLPEEYPDYRFLVRHLFFPL